MPEDPSRRWGEVGIHGLHRLREWDAVATVSAPGLAGERLELVALEDGRTLPPHAAALADAVRVPRPFRAEAVNRGNGTWAVAARRIAVRALDALGDEVERVEDGVVLRGRRVDGDLWEVEETPL